MRDQHSNGHQSPSVCCLRTALILMSLASVDTRMGAELMGKARDVAFSREDLVSLKAISQTGDQENGILGDIMSVRGFTKDARLGRNWR